MNETAGLTVEVWRLSEDPAEAATPMCPKCGWSLGIRHGMFRAYPHADAWLCDRCGEMETI